ncbi:MAG: hypothetical protein PVI30_20010 [Myxococcales bacterium]|jgi:hypothetical protein
MKVTRSLLTLCGLLAACGGDDGSSGGGSPALQTCYDVCQAQDAAEVAGNCPGIGLDACRFLCDAAATGECWQELTASNECMLTGQFDCGLFSAESNADCDAEYAAYDDCAVESADCVGATEDGFCPAVSCACPDGETTISAFVNEGGQCMCVDSNTCTEFCF